MDIRRIFCLLLSIVFSLNTHADIGVSPIIVDLTGKDAETEIAVKNFDTKQNAYVEITPYRLMNPGNHSAPKQLARRALIAGDRLLQ